MINPHQIRPGSPISAAHVRSVATASMAGGLAQAARGLSSYRRGIVAAPASSARLANTGWSDAAKRERQASQLPRHPVGGIYTGGTPWFDEKTGQYVMPVPPWLLPPGGGGAPGGGQGRRGQAGWGCAKASLDARAGADGQAAVRAAGVRPSPSLSARYVP